MASSQEVQKRLSAALADRYLIQEEIGSGGMATVYRAEDLKHRRSVAVKVLDPELSAVVGTDRFLAEIETTANLQHPNILPLFEELSDVLLGMREAFEIIFVDDGSSDGSLEILEDLAS